MALRNHVIHYNIQHSSSGKSQGKRQYAARYRDGEIAEKHPHDLDGTAYECDDRRSFFARSCF